MSDTYAWFGWERESDLGNDDDRAGVEYLTIATDDGDELAVIVHRAYGDDRDAVAKSEKEARASLIVRALNALATD